MMIVILLYIFTEIGGVSLFDMSFDIELQTYFLEKISGL